MNTNKTITIELGIDELRAVVKSLSIGCDQLAKKALRLGSGKTREDVASELTLLSNAKWELESALNEAL